MPKLLMNLRNVPDDEADEVRALLEERNVPFYETKPSFWGVSGGGIWIRRQEDVAEAQRLMSEYQSQRRARARAEFQAAKREGTAKSFWGMLRERPLIAVGVLVVIAFLAMVLALPFLILRD